MKWLFGNYFLSRRHWVFTGTLFIFVFDIFSGSQALANRCESLFVGKRQDQTEPPASLVQSLADLFLDIEGQTEGATRRRLTDDFKVRWEGVSQQYGPQGIAILKSEIARRRQQGTNAIDGHRQDPVNRSLELQRRSIQAHRETLSVKGEFVDFLDSRQMVLRKYSSIKVFDFETGKEVSTLARSSIVNGHVAINPDQKTGILFGDSGIELIDFVGWKTEMISAPIPGGGMSLGKLLRSENGKMNFFVPSLRLLRVEGRDVVNIPVPFTPDVRTKYDLSPNGQMIVRIQEDGNLFIFDIDSGNVRELPHPPGVRVLYEAQTAFFSPDSKTIWWQANNTDWFQYDVATHVILQSIQMPKTEYFARTSVTEDRKWVVRVLNELERKKMAFQIFNTLTGELRNEDWYSGDPSLLSGITVDLRHNRIGMFEQSVESAEKVRKAGDKMEVRRYFIYEIDTENVETIKPPEGTMHQGRVMLSPDGNSIFDSSDFRSY